MSPVHGYNLSAVSTFDDLISEKRERIWAIGQLIARRIGRKEERGLLKKKKKGGKACSGATVVGRIIQAIGEYPLSLLPQNRTTVRTPSPFLSLLNADSSSSNGTL